MRGLGPVARLACLTGLNPNIAPLEAAIEITSSGLARNNAASRPDTPFGLVKRLPLAAIALALGIAFTIIVLAFRIVLAPMRERRGASRIEGAPAAMDRS